MYFKLSKREKEVLNLILWEHNTKEIAEKLFISTNTVGSHRKNLLSKMGVRNSVGLIRKSFQFGLIDIEIHNQKINIEQ